MTISYRLNEGNWLTPHRVVLGPRLEHSKHCPEEQWWMNHLQYWDPEYYNSAGPHEWRVPQDWRLQDRGLLANIRDQFWLRIVDCLKSPPDYFLCWVGPGQHVRCQDDLLPEIGVFCTSSPGKFH